MHPKVESDRVLPRRLRARRWSYGGTREAFGATAHGGFEVGWLEQGALRYHLGGRTLEATPGRAVLIPVGVDHATEFVGPMRGASVHLDDALLTAVAEAAGVALPDTPLVLDDCATLLKLGALLQEELARDTADARLCADALAEAMAARLLAAAPPAPASLDPRVRRAVDHIRACFAEPLEVEDIAAACGTSRFHLSRLFKGALGKSPYQYLLEVRLDEAARGLRRGQSVTQAAFSAGFSDLSRFARMFQRRFGMAPSAMGRAYSTTAAKSASSMAPSPLVS